MLKRVVDALGKSLKATTEVAAYRSSVMDSVQSDVLEPLLDFHTQLTILTKTLKKQADKTNDELESCMVRYLGQSKFKKKSLDIANAVLEAKKNACKSNLHYVNGLNLFNSKKETFLIDKVCRWVHLLVKESEVPILKTNFAEELNFSKTHIDDNRGWLSKINADSIEPKKIFSSQLDLASVDLSLNQNGSPAKNLVIVPNCRGYLWKKGKGPIRSWNRYWYWISSQDGFLMSFTKSKTSLEPVVIVDLSSAQYREVDSDERWNVFELDVSNSVHIFLQAENDRLFKKWIATFSAIKNGTYHKLFSPAPLSPRRPSNSNEQKSRRKAIYASDTSPGSQDELSSSESLSIPPPPSSAVNPPSPSVSHADVILSGYLAIKETKPMRRPSVPRDIPDAIWRTARFSLHLDNRMYQINGPSGSERFEVLDLVMATSRLSIQSVDDSLFARKFVFSVSLETGRTFYFAAADGLQRNAWVLALKRSVENIKVSNEARIARTLSVRVIEGRGFSSSIDPYCEIYFGKELKARTNIRFKTNGEPFWREDFTFEDIPAPRNGLSVVVMGHNRIQRDTEIGQVFIAPSGLHPGEVEAWYPIMGPEPSAMSGLFGNANQDQSMDLKLKVRYEEDIVLKLREYAGLQDIFQHVTCDLVHDLLQVSPDMEYIAMLLVNIYDGQGLAIAWLKYLVEQEIKMTDKPNVLFRANTILTKSMDAYMKVCCMDYLDHTLGSVIRQIIDERQACEVDPTRLEKNDDLKQNWRRLMEYASILWKNIQKSEPHIPRELRILFHTIQRAVIRRYNDDRDDKFTSIRYISVSGFIFLRLFCPAILSPKLFGLTKEHPDQKTSRTLTLLAKTLQCLANLANFGMKEPFMVEMNSFIMDHSNDCMEFIDSISTFPSSSTPLIPHLIDLEYQFCLLHRFIMNNEQALQKLETQYQESMTNRAYLIRLALGACRSLESTLQQMKNPKERETSA